MNYVKIYGKLEEGLELECGLGKIEPTFKTSVTISEKIKKSSTYFSFCHLLIIIFEKSSTLVQKWEEKMKKSLTMVSGMFSTLKKIIKRHEHWTYFHAYFSIQKEQFKHKVQEIQNVKERIVEIRVP